MSHTKDITLSSAIKTLASAVLAIDGAGTIAASRIVIMHALLAAAPADSLSSLCKSRLQFSNCIISLAIASATIAMIGRENIPLGAYTCISARCDCISATYRSRQRRKFQTSNVMATSKQRNASYAQNQFCDLVVIWKSYVVPRHVNCACHAYSAHIWCFWHVCCVYVCIYMFRPRFEPYLT